MDGHAHTSDFQPLLYLTSLSVYPRTENVVIVKVKNRLDATKYVVFIASTCFGHQYAHHQEYN
jgi:hypothetical protein